MILLFSLISKKKMQFVYKDTSAYVILEIFGLQMSEQSTQRPLTCFFCGFRTCLCCHLTVKVQAFLYSESSWAYREILRIHNTWVTSLNAHLLTCPGAYKYMTLSSSEMKFSRESPKRSHNCRNFSSSTTTERLNVLLKTVWSNDQKLQSKWTLRADCLVSILNLF